ncbi:SnoaL-like polyketide cyclase [Promicromonospora sp. AC04]|uniref:ester cyclase n=1 Tax=Promicromonospora sp. AC04 TaxID=2135723 RepID=UPI000D34464D|nr:ester cyclase [Promicromonospora sp. AC04]PUB27658.1 SnoaL-like polyketide cyclase [Promicromonospora sp. AC04]
MTTPDNDRVAHNLQLMKEADDAFNARDYAGFLDHLHTQDVVVYQPNLAQPTHALEDHRAEVEWLVRAFPDLHVHNDLYELQFGQGDWTLALGRMTGTFTGEMTAPDGTVVPPTGKGFDIQFTTIARWRDGKIAEERILWDQSAISQQTGLAD